MGETSYTLDEIIIRPANNGYFVILNYHEGNDSSFVAKTFIEAVNILIDHIVDPFEPTVSNSNVIPIRKD